MRFFQTILLVSALASAAGAEENATIPGDVTTPSPTILNLAIEWKIEGDANLNGAVGVRYRQAGDEAWREAMPLRRVPAGESRGTRPIFHWENKHSGSIFDLRPNTEYEIALNLADPDGGSAKRTVHARTRPVPRPAADARQRPASLSDLNSARPGEILLLQAGDYGEFVVPRDGEPGRPIVFRSLDGKAVFSSISLRNRKHVHLEGLTIRPIPPDRAPGSTWRGPRIAWCGTALSTPCTAFAPHRRPARRAATSRTMFFKALPPGGPRRWAPTATTSAKESR